MKDTLKNVKVCGLDGISSIFFEKKSYSCDGQERSEWILTSEGGNLLEIFSVPGVDKYKTTSNNMWEIYSVLGIEAARQFLIEEFCDVLSSDGSWVGACHVELLVDVMCNMGSIISISRFGLKKIDSGVLASSSFEESIVNFCLAGINGRVEKINGVSASIMLGKVPNVGTGAVELMMDIPHHQTDTCKDLDGAPTGGVFPVNFFNE